MSHLYKKCMALLFILLSCNAWAEKAPGRTVIDGCWKKPGSHVAIVECEAKTRDKLKEEMHAIYEQRKDETQENDKEMNRINATVYAGREKALIDSQQAFEEYMASECNRQVTHVAGGTAGADVQLGCEIDLLTQRIDALTRNP